MPRRVSANACLPSADGLRRLRASLRQPVLACQAMPITMQNLAKSCIPKELLYTLNNVGVGQSQRHKLMSFMDDASKKEMEIVHLAVDAVTKCNISAYSDDGQKCLKSGKPNVGDTCFAKKKVYCLT